MFSASRAGTIILALSITSVPARGQAERYELGSRMKAFEAAWENADDAGRARAKKTIPDATTQFLSFRFAEAGRTLDLSRYHLTNEGAPGAARAWRDSLAVQPESRLVDGSKSEIAITVQPLYGVKDPRPANLEVKFWFVNDVVTTLRPEKFPATVKVPLPPLGEFTGLDRRLFVSIDAGKERVVRSIAISQVKDLRPRLEALRKVVAGWTVLDTVEKATVRDRLTQLTELADGVHPETDLPASSLLANAEAMLDGKPFFSPGKSGEFWMSVPLGGMKTLPVRVLVPKGLDATKPVPVVVALHGAGGSENLFFEGYGAGCVVKECRERGWLLVSPRSGLAFLSTPPVPEMLKALGERFPIDAKRTFLLGHSMGAAQTLELVQANPGRFAAAAMLGGGGRVRKPEAVTMPLFIGAGSRDFALSAAKRTADAVKTATFKEYPGVEHLLIVREAVGDVFRMFDVVVK